MTEIHTSYNTEPIGYLAPPAVEHPPLKHFSKGNIAHFEDGSSVKVDVLIFGTGYRIHYPFMEKSLRMTGPVLHYPEKLYKVLHVLP